MHKQKTAHYRIVYRAKERMVSRSLCPNGSGLHSIYLFFLLHVCLCACPSAHFVLPVSFYVCLLFLSASRDSFLLVLPSQSFKEKTRIFVKKPVFVDHPYVFVFLVALNKHLP
jgi:hypothetical protein